MTSPQKRHKGENCDFGCPDPDFEVVYGFPLIVRSCSGPFRPKSVRKHPFSSVEDRKKQMRPKPLSKSIRLWQRVSARIFLAARGRFIIKEPPVKSIQHLRPFKDIHFSVNSLQGHMRSRDQNPRHSYCRTLYQATKGQHNNSFYGCCRHSSLDLFQHLIPALV